MELPPDVKYVEDANLFIWRPRGVLNEALVNNIIVFVREQEETLTGRLIDSPICPLSMQSISISITFFTSHSIDGSRTPEVR